VVIRQENCGYTGIPLFWLSSNERPDLVAGKRPAWGNGVGVVGLKEEGTSRKWKGGENETRAPRQTEKTPSMTGKRGELQPATKWQLEGGQRPVRGDLSYLGGGTKKAKKKLLQTSSGGW